MAESSKCRKTERDSLRFPKSCGVFGSHCRIAALSLLQLTVLQPRGLQNYICKISTPCPIAETLSAQKHLHDLHCLNKNEFTIQTHDVYIYIMIGLHYTSIVQYTLNSSTHEKPLVTWQDYALRIIYFGRVC